MTLSQTLTAIVDWYRQNVPNPEGHIVFRPGLTRSEIIECEKEFGFPFDECLVELYRFGDGMSQGGLLYRNSALLSLREAISTNLKYRRNLEGFNDAIESPLVPGVKQESWTNGWLPLSDNGGDHTLVDLNPAEGGLVGQVLHYFHERAAVDELLAPNLTAYFTNLLTELNEGMHFWSEVNHDVEPLAWQDLGLS